MYYTYIIESVTTFKWYYGHTEDIKKRVIEHNMKGSNYTSGTGPWKLIFVREFDSRSQAVKFERYLKKLKNKAYIKRQFSVYFDTSKYRDVAQSG